ncbi:Endoribonuclease Dicer [Desmophyllum pertusum]|uniref:Endoribonuclease Dicer n=1 Tax=Desmophyllum pertusum TaxID=174260 RepID=A0A9W9ZMA9_9CNID|nr:Endoribonuclease Dicer [Desmophyllum pertusum]
MDEEESEIATESETEDQEPEDSRLTARPYQVELLERAKKRNTIVCLGTGTGKTFISVMLIKELAHEVRETYKDGGKRTFFLVNTVPLASQQAKVIGDHTDLKVKHYVGEMGVDFWDKSVWEKEFNEFNVLVMTAQIFLDLLHHAYIRLSQVNLLIFDECHHATKNHSYKQIMQFFNSCPEDAHPKVMGLTASVVNGKVKPSKIQSEIIDLECTLRSTCATSQDGDVEKFAAKPKEEVLICTNENIGDDTNKLVQKLRDVLKPGIDFLHDCRVSSNDSVKNAHWFAKLALRECQGTLDELGPWAAYRVAGYLIKDLGLKLGRDNIVFHVPVVDPEVLKTGGPKRTWPFSCLTTESDGENKLCGIVFVERRYTALVLSEQINIAAKLDHDLTFIKSSFVIGHGTRWKG